jgi:hypothetical protein
MRITLPYTPKVYACICAYKYIRIRLYVHTQIHTNVRGSGEMPMHLRAAVVLVYASAYVSAYVFALNFVLKIDGRNLRNSL